MKIVLCILAVGILALLIGCASRIARPTGSPGISVAPPAPASPPSDLKPPLMFNEASLPAGFPPPGPVGEVIVKEYPPYRVARTIASPGTGNAANAMFRPLFQHIKKNNIAMTAPVEMTYESDANGRDDQPLAMAFMYATPDLGTPSRDNTVEVIDLPAQTVLSVTLRGNYQASYETGIKLLRETMDRTPGRYEVTGPPRFMGYNSPFVPPFLRIGEAQLPVKVIPAANP